MNPKHPKYYVHEVNNTSRDYDTQLYPLPRSEEGVAMPTDELLECRDMILNDFTKIYKGQFIPLTLLGFAMAAPLIDYFNPPVKKFAIHLEGLRGAGKTHMAQTALNLHGYKPLRLSGGVNATWTVNSIERELFFQSGVIQLVDDIKIDMMSIDEAQRFKRIFQGYHDRQGRGRLKQNLESAPQSYIRGMLLSTGENLPTSNSAVLSRMIVLHTTLEDYNADLVEEKIVGREHILSRLFPHWIAWTQRQGTIGITRRLKVREKERAEHFLNVIAAVLEYYLQGFMVEEMGADKKKMERLVRKWCTGAKSLAMENIEITDSQREDELFLSTVRSLLMTGACNVDEGNFGANSTRIGFIDGDYIHLFQEITLQAVLSCSRGHKWDKASVSRLLRKNGWLHPTKTGKTGGKGVGINTWIIRKSVLLPDDRSMSVFDVQDFAG